MAAREGGQRLGGLAVEHAAAGHDQRAFRPTQQRDRAGQLVRVGTGPAQDGVQAGGEERLGPVMRLGLDVLAQGQRHGPALDRVGQHLHRTRQRGQKLLGPGDPVPPARDRPEAVGDAQGGVVEVLDLLQHRVGPAAREHVARQQQHRQPVDVRHPGRGQHVHRPGADRGRAGHHPAPVHRLGVGDRRQRHALLVVRPEGRQRVARLMERLAHARDVAVAEDRPAAGEQRHLSAVHDRVLRREKPHQRLRRRQPDSTHPFASPAAMQPHGPTGLSQTIRSMARGK